MAPSAHTAQTVLANVEDEMYTSYTDYAAQQFNVPSPRTQDHAQNPAPEGSTRSTPSSSRRPRLTCNWKYGSRKCSYRAIDPNDFEFVAPPPRLPQNADIGNERFIREHQRAHRQCPKPGCYDEFPDGKSIRRHLGVDHRPWAEGEGLIPSELRCDICNELVRRADNLRRHKQEKHGDRKRQRKKGA